MPTRSCHNTARHHAFITSCVSQRARHKHRLLLDVTTYTNNSIQERNQRACPTGFSGQASLTPYIQLCDSRPTPTKQLLQAPATSNIDMGSQPTWIPSRPRPPDLTHCEQLCRRLDREGFATNRHCHQASAARFPDCIHTIFNTRHAPAPQRGAPATSDINGQTERLDNGT